MSPRLHRSHSKDDDKKEREREREREKRERDRKRKREGEREKEREINHYSDMKPDQGYVKSLFHSLAMTFKAIHLFSTSGSVVLVGLRVTTLT